jgi:cyclase
MDMKHIAGMLAILGTLQLPLANADDHNTLKTTAITDTIHVVSGNGGNVTVVKDTRGLLVIDDGLNSKSEELMMTVGDMADTPVKFLVNTHWHYDHVGGNAAMHDDGATILAHHNVHQRMVNGGTIAAFNAEIAPAKADELPVITYHEGLRFHWGNDVFDVQHFPAGHTDGDSVVFVKEANVVVMGDIYFHSMYPFIDASSGGSVKGVVNAVSQVIEVINDDTVVIPGHGAVTASKDDLISYRDMLQTMHDKLAAMKKAGKTADEAVAAKPTAEFDAEFNDGFLKADTWVKVVYDAI